MIHNILNVLFNSMILSPKLLYTPWTTISSNGLDITIWQFWGRFPNVFFLLGHLVFTKVQPKTKYEKSWTNVEKTVLGRQIWDKKLDRSGFRKHNYFFLFGLTNMFVVYYNVDYFWYYKRCSQCFCFPRNNFRSKHF